jgi:hypothetical protein
MPVLDLLNKYQQSLTAHNFLVPKLKLVYVQALARYVMSQQLHITKGRRGYSGESNGPEYGPLTVCLDHENEN